MSVRLGVLKQRLPALPADLDQEVGDLYQQIGDLASDIQALSHGLHPPKLELLGLDAAVTGLCEELSRRHGVKIDVHFENLPNALPPEISLCLYRVLQEALQNIVKHASRKRDSLALSSVTRLTSTMFFCLCEIADGVAAPHGQTRNSADAVSESPTTRSVRRRF